MWTQVLPTWTTSHSNTYSNTTDSNTNSNTTDSNTSHSNTNSNTSNTSDTACTISRLVPKEQPSQFLWHL